MSKQDMGAIPGSRKPSRTVSALPGFDPARKEWQHVLEDGSFDHEWVTEFGVTFCTHCEVEKGCDE